MVSIIADSLERAAGFSGSNDVRVNERRCRAQQRAQREERVFRSAGVGQPQTGSRRHNRVLI